MKVVIIPFIPIGATPPTFIVNIVCTLLLSIVKAHHLVKGLKSLYNLLIISCSKMTTCICILSLYIYVYSIN